jgi:hypothetical protein
MELDEFLSALVGSDEPSIAYKARVLLLGDDPTAPDVVELRDAIRRSERVRALLAERGADGTIPHHPYAKWYGAHWVLVALADLEYPPGDPSLIPLREQELAWLLGEDRAKLSRRLTFGGHTRMCASMEGNAIYALLKLGLADARIDTLVERLLAWQWPDGGWNCDKKRDAHVSSFHETLIPLRGLAWYGRETGSGSAIVAARRAAEVFLQRRLFRRLSDGSVIEREFVRLHYPAYWHFDALFGLKVMAEAGLLGDPHCVEALDLLESRQLSDGGFPSEGKYYHLSDSPENGRSLVDWGGTSIKHANPWVTVEALAVLKGVGRNLTPRPSPRRGEG